VIAAAESMSVVIPVIGNLVNGNVGCSPDGVVADPLPRSSRTARGEVRHRQRVSASKVAASVGIGEPRVSVDVSQAVPTLVFGTEQRALVLVEPA
jgi:hypothetical protein